MRTIFTALPLAISAEGLKVCWWYGVAAQTRRTYHDAVGAEGKSSATATNVKVRTDSAMSTSAVSCMLEAAEKNGRREQFRK